MTEIKTPFNPSKSATKRVKNPIEAPTECPYCGGTVVCVSNSEIYGREYGEWPWAYMCENKDAYVGLHPYTSIPLGTLADKTLRGWRRKAKDAFYSWAKRKGYHSRKESYPALAELLNLETEKTHFGWFDIDQCKRVYGLCK